MENNIKVEVAYAEPTQQHMLQLVLPANSSIRVAIAQSKLTTGSMDSITVGIFGKLRCLDFILQDGDRVEIYRQLLIDPKEARTQRVKRDQRAKRQKISNAPSADC